jgi:N-acetylmuramoyl-L-alanine amidase
MVRRLLLAAALVLVFPASSSAGLASLEIRELALGSDRLLSGTSATKPFQLVGIHWRGPGRLELRTRSATDRWSAWTAVEEGDHDGPDVSSAERRLRASWRMSAPVWVGQAVALEVRTIGRVTRVRALTVRSPVSKVGLRTPASATVPKLVGRSAWLADEAIVRGKPAYADTMRMAYVHHTAGTNSYTRLQAPAVVRAIQLYHVKGNGWNDIGYNALIDRFGTVYEGRAGGIDRNVVGAHARGFNTGSFGIAVMGDFRTVDPPQAAVDALVGTLAWRLDLAHVDPLSTFNGISSGNERFGPGLPVFLRAISGHRDTGATTCPGERLYARLGEIARRVSTTGLPKLYAPLAAADEAGIRFRARLSSSLAWSVVVTDAAGNELGRGDGTGTSVDWTWRPDGPLPVGTRWRIEAPGATAAEGGFGTLAPVAPAVLQIGAATATPGTISPNGDGQADTATIAFTLNGDANVIATVVDATGTTVAQLEPLRWRRAGARTMVFDGRGLPDGAYAVRVSARATGGRLAEIDVPLIVSRLLGRVTLSDAVLTPNGDGRSDVLSIGLPLAAPATVTVRILREGRWVATPFSGTVDPGERVVTWDGSKRLGRAADGTYAVSVEATDGAGTSRVELPLALDSTAPRLHIVSAVPPVLRVSEPVTLLLRVNGARRTVRVTAPGPVRIPRIERLRTLVATATDAAGNRTVLRR